MQFLEKLWKMREKIEILNLPKQKEEETIEMKKTRILMYKPDHSGLSSLELSEILMYEF